MEVLDTSIANVALPHIAGGLSASEDEATWVLTSYLVSNAIILPFSGWFSLLVGRKRFYMLCVLRLHRSVRFFAASRRRLGLLGLLSHFAGRRRRRIAAQRTGNSGRYVYAQSSAAWLLPCTRSRSCSRRPLGRRWAATSPITISWRWIFFINIPVGILSIALSSFMLEDPPYLVKERKAEKEGKPAGRLLGHYFHRHRLGLPADHARQGRSRRLVLFRFHPHCAPFWPWAVWSMAVYWELKIEESGRGSQPAERPQL